MQKPLYLVEKSVFLAVWMVLALILAVSSPAGAGETDEVRLSKAECAGLLKSTPVAARTAPGVAFQPGVDVRGNKVAGADLNPRPAIKVPDEIVFPMNVDLEEKYGIGSKGVFASEGTVGEIRVRGGQVFWNDQPLDGGDEGRVRTACQQAYGGK